MKETADGNSVAQPLPPSFVVFSDDWGEHMSSSQHIFRHIAQRHSVIWVNTIGMRSPNVSLDDLQKAWRKVSRMRYGRREAVRAAEGQVTVCQPLMLPFGFRVARAWNARSVTRTLRRLAGDLPDRIIVATVPNVGDYTDLLQDSMVVYYCVDDFAQWPGLDRQLVRDMEQRLIARADVLVATSAKLYDRLATSGKPTYLLTHGVDVELFSRRADSEHACLAGIPRPRAGFFGLIDDRTDQHLLGSVAERMADLSFVLAGPIEASIPRLAARSNVHFTGPIRYGELPELIAGLDVLFIPYSTGEFADTLSPLKLNEYLLTGKPIISTPIAASRMRSSHVAIAASVDEWVAELRRALLAGSTARRNAILPAMEAESWACKARALLDICATLRNKRRDA